MIICVCKNVSERDIAQAVAEGCNSFAALQEELEVGRCCGTCECAARDAFSEKRAACQGRHHAAAAAPRHPQLAIA
jgi:bacterioferritin-associated ferredoxin